jgi:hypothetical protein
MKPEAKQLLQVVSSRIANDAVRLGQSDNFAEFSHRHRANMDGALMLVNSHVR